MEEADEPNEEDPSAPEGKNKSSKAKGEKIHYIFVEVSYYIMQ